MSKFYEPLKIIVEKDDWKIVEENEHTLACSCNGLNGWAISGMSVVEYSQRRLAFFRVLTGLEEEEDTDAGSQ